MDLGQNWEEKTGAPIPLGGIVIRDSLPLEIKKSVNRLVRESIEWANNQYIKNHIPLSSFIKANAQVMEPKVMRLHIDLYVNEYSLSLGEVGRNAIRTLLKAGTDSSSNISKVESPFI